MKKLLFAILFLCSALNVSAQNNNSDNMEIQAAIDACIAMRDAVAAQDSAAIRQSAKDLKDLNVSHFYTLHCQDDSVSSLDGHLLFDEAFADSLAEGKDVYNKADEIERKCSVRGQTADGSILTKTCFVKAGKSTKWNFTSKGPQELAVVAEAGGLVTMRIHVTNSAGLDCRYDDTKSVKKGLPQRKTSFDLPKDKKNLVELEIVNCGKKDCSFVVISN